MNSEFDPDQHIADCERHMLEAAARGDYKTAEAWKQDAEHAMALRDEIVGTNMKAEDLPFFLRRQSV